MNDLRQLTALVAQFRDKRDWEQFHDAKSLAASISIEAGELLEIFQWATTEDSKKPDIRLVKRAEEELADVFYYVLLLAHQLQIDLTTALPEKMKHNAQKYPVNKAKGNSRKYTELK